METPNMTRTITLSLLTATALLSSMAVANAADITVKIAGQSPTQIRTEVTTAAAKVCADAVKHDETGDYASEDQCETDTVAATMKQVAAIDLGYQVASADASRPR
jgi:hypothetical protein